jgi:hypothetical protein
VVAHMQTELPPLNNTPLTKEDGEVKNKIKEIYNLRKKSHNKA